MPYTPQSWADNDPTKPVSAARMQHIEDGLAAVANGDSLAATELAAQPYRVYMSLLNGSDANSGNSPGHAVQTLAKAIALLQQAGHGGVVSLVDGLGAGNIDLAAPVSVVYPVRIESMSLTANTIRRTFATPNGRSVWDAITTAGGGSVQSATASFVAGDVNRIAMIYGAGTGGGTFYDFISAVPDGTHATLTATTAIARNATTDPKGVKLSVIGDWNRVVTDAAMTSGGSGVTSATANWTAADIGTEIVVGGAGQGGQALSGAIKSISGTTATITAVASATVSGKRCAIGVNFGNLFTYHVGQCGLSRTVVTDQTSGNASIGAQIKIVSDDLGAGVISSPSDLLFEDGTSTSSDAAGAWEHMIDIDGSWNQNASGTGARRGCFRNWNVFGARRATETIRIVNGVHWSFEGKTAVAAAPTAIAQGYMLLDPQKNGGSGLVATQDINFIGCEGTGAYFYSEGSRTNFIGGSLAPSVAVTGRNVIELAAISDHCAVITQNAATTNADEVDNGPTNIVVTQLSRDGLFVARADAAARLTGVVFESIPRRQWTNASQVLGSSGVLVVQRVWIAAGVPVTKIGLHAGGAALAWGTAWTGPHFIYGVYDANGNLIGQSTDTGGTQAFNSTWASEYISLSSTVRSSVTGLGAVALLINSGTGGSGFTYPNFAGFANALAAVAPILCGTTGSGLTALPGTVTYGSLTAFAGQIFAALGN